MVPAPEVRTRRVAKRRPCSHARSGREGWLTAGGEVTTAPEPEEWRRVTDFTKTPLSATFDMCLRLQ